MTLTIGIDLGTSGVKAVILQDAETVLADAEEVTVEELQSVAHKLKGAAAAVGLAWVMQQARALEEQEPDWQGLQRQLLELHFTAEQHLATLQQYIEQY